MGNANNREFFRHCPKCGSGEFRAAEVKKFECQSCRFELYFNAAAAVAALITDDSGCLLVTVRGAEPEKGMWDLPGGFVDPGESVEETLRREIKEELGLELCSLRYLCSSPNVYEYKGVSYPTIDLAYICEVGDVSKAKASDDIDSIAFKSRAEIVPEKFGFESIRRIISFYLSNVD